jgi:HK97 family phage portal protein
VTLFAPLLVRNSGSELERPEIPISSERIVDLFGGEKSTAGVSVTEKKVLGIPAVWRAVNLIAGTTGSLPFGPFRAEGAARRPVTSGQAATLLGNPHPDMTPMELMELIVGHALLWGDAYCWRDRDGLGRPLHLLPLHPSRIKAGRTREGVKVYQLDGTMPLTDYEILHVPGFGQDGIGGVSPVRAAREGFGLALAAEEFGARLFSNGALSTGILTTDGRLNEEQADALHARWKQKRTGLDKAFGTIILDGGLHYQQLTIPPQDAQFLESRSFQVSEIARMFGVPPHMLMDTDKATSWGTGIEQQSIGFLVFTLRPWLTRIEQRFTRILKPEPVYARFTVEGLLRADSAARAAFYKEMWYLGVFSTNDIRALEELPPVEGGDVRYRPLNMGALGSTDNNDKGGPDA